MYVYKQINKGLWNYENKLSYWNYGGLKIFNSIPCLPLPIDIYHATYRQCNRQ